MQQNERTVESLFFSSVITAVETSCLYSVLPTIEHDIYVHFNWMGCVCVCVCVCACARVCVCVCVSVRVHIAFGEVN
jgi:hypothetical protein